MELNTKMDVSNEQNNNGAAPNADLTSADYYWNSYAHFGKIDKKTTDLI